MVWYLTFDENVRIFVLKTGRTMSEKLNDLLFAIVMVVGVVAIFGILTVLNQVFDSVPILRSIFGLVFIIGVVYMFLRMERKSS